MTTPYHLQRINTFALLEAAAIDRQDWPRRRRVVRLLRAFLNRSR